VFPITATLTGRLGEDPRPFTTRDGTDGAELRLALDMPSRTGGETYTKWVRVNAFGVLAARTAASVRKGDLVTITAHDVTADAWMSKDKDKPEPRATLTFRATDIAASMRYDTLTTGRADRQAARAAAANGDATSLPAHEEAEARVLAGVTAS
jgi:single-stranded DNA-binding protein